MTTDLDELDRMLDPLAQCWTPEVAFRIAQLRADPETQSVIDALADKNTEGELSEDERQKYETLVRANDVVAILQAKARSILSGQNSL